MHETPYSYFFKYTVLKNTRKKKLNLNHKNQWNPKPLSFIPFIVEIIQSWRFNALNWNLGTMILVARALLRYYWLKFLAIGSKLFLFADNFRSFAESTNEIFVTKKSNKLIWDVLFQSLIFKTNKKVMSKL